MQVIERCSDSVVILFATIFLGVSRDVGCLHMLVGLKVESLWLSCEVMRAS